MYAITLPSKTNAARKRFTSKELLRFDDNRLFSIFHSVVYWFSSVTKDPSTHPALRRIYFSLLFLAAFWIPGRW